MAYQEILAGLKSGDKKRVCKELESICPAVEADEEVVVHLGLGGIHTELHRLLVAADEDVAEASAQAIEACIQNCPYGVSFPMTAKRLDAQYADPFILMDLGLADVTTTSEINSCGQEHGEPPSSWPFGHEESAQPSSSSLQIRLRKIRESPDDSKKIGNMLWLSAIALSRWIVRNQTAVSGRSVLEIGSGLGLGGIVAGRYADSVVLTDFDPVIVRNLEYNVRCNRGVLREEGHFCSARTLDWYNLPEKTRASGAGEPSGTTSKSRPSDLALKFTCNEPVHTAASNWARLQQKLGCDGTTRNIACLGGAELKIDEGRLPGDSTRAQSDSAMRPGEGPGDRFDVVLGSDVIHEQSMADGVVSVLKRYLQSDGVAIILNPHSHHRAGVERFQKLLSREGFAHKVTEIDGMGKEQSLHVVEVKDRSKQVRTGVMARFEEEMGDVRLQLHRISLAP